MTLDQDTFQLLRNSVQRFIWERLVPAEDYIEEHNEVPADIVGDMKELGLFGLSIPEEFGGIGLSMAQECEVAYELGHTALAFRSVVGTNIGIGSQGILMDGTFEQKAQYLPLIASGGAGAPEHFPPAVEAGARIRVTSVSRKMIANWLNAKLRLPDTRAA